MLFLVCFWLFYAATIIYEAYISEVYISPDSAAYLREADAIAGGFGFNYNGMAGGEAWFSRWPIGYPALIAAVSVLLPWVNTYLCSKILAIILVGVMLVVFGVHFKRRAWLYALVLLNPGIMQINYYTWSETALMPLLLLFALLLAEIIDSENPPKSRYVMLSALMLSSFLVRYFGAVTLLAAITAEGCLLVKLRLLRGGASAEVKGKACGLLAAIAATGLFIVGYLLMNLHFAGYLTGQGRTAFTDDVLSLTQNLFESIQVEVRDALIVGGSHPLFKHLGFKAQAVLAVGILLALVTLLTKRHKLDEPAVLIVCGLLYYALFVFVRYRSTMDPFGTRFFAPASLLVLVGLVSIFWERFPDRSFRSVECAVAFLMVLSVGSMISSGFKVSETAYDVAERENLERFVGVPTGAVMLDYHQTEGETSLPLYFREDLIFERADAASIAIGEQETLEQLKERFSANGNICVNKQFAEVEIIDDGSGYYSNSLKEYIKDGLSNQSHDQVYLVFPTV